MYKEYSFVSGYTSGVCELSKCLAVNLRKGVGKMLCYQSDIISIAHPFLDTEAVPTILHYYTYGQVKRHLTEVG